MKLKILPLESATVNIINAPEINGTQHIWSVASRKEVAHNLTNQLLDPEGPARWGEEEDRRKELARQNKEWRAEVYAQSMCYLGSTQAECAEDRQLNRNRGDEFKGRVRNEEKEVVGPCRRQHMCLVCFRADMSASKEERIKKGRKCPRPGICDKL